MSNVDRAAMTGRTNWLSVMVAFVAGAVVAWCVSVGVGYYDEVSREVYPGNDFPVSWAGRDVLGASYDAAVSVEEFTRDARVREMKQAYEVWCATNNLEPRRDLPPP